MKPAPKTIAAVMTGAVLATALTLAIHPGKDDGTVKPPDMGQRSTHWPKVRADFLKDHSSCAACGVTEGLEVHHVLSFHEHPDRELDPDNLITLCERHRCHFTFGHLWNWRTNNPNVREDTAKMLKAKAKARKVSLAWPAPLRRAA